MGLNLMVISDGLVPNMTPGFWSMTVIKADEDLRGSNVSCDKFRLGIHGALFTYKALAFAEIKKMFRWSKSLNGTTYVIH